MMSIVTRTGDDGTTGLLGGSRVSKSSLRIHSCGAIDELNAVIGLVLAERTLPAAIRFHLDALQHILFRLGTDIVATDTPPTERVHARDVRLVDEWIASLECSLPPLQHFIVPGGSRTAALLHCARTVCRRAERWTVALAEKEHVNPQACVFLNRLSDHLFLAARTVNSMKEEQERRIDYTR